MKINVRPEDCKFYVNEEKRKVICVFSDAKHLLNDFLWCEGYDVKFDDALLPPKFVGVATCSINDTWDEAYGRKLAFHRMKEKLHRSFFRAANNFVNAEDCKLQKLVTSLNDYGARVSATMRYAEEKLNLNSIEE